MGDIGTREAAIRLGLTQQTVAKYCRKGLIENATQDKEGSPWHIPITSIESFLKARNKKGFRKK